jgi:hypothetical protein
MKIPPEEIERLNACVRDAWELADHGREEEGFEVLDLGLMWAETPALNPVTWEQSPPDPWAAALIALYRQELARYLLKHHHAVGPRGLARRAQILREVANALCAMSRSLCADAARLKESSVQSLRSVPVGPTKGKPH